MNLLAPDALSQAADTPARSYVAAFANCDSRSLIHNLSTRMLLLEHDELSLPLSLTDRYQSGNSYVVSPQSACVDYAADELPPLPSWLQGLLRTTLAATGHWLERRELDRHVAINNWLLSTNLYPPQWDGAGITPLTDALCQSFPEHALVWRSLNPFTNAALLRAFSEQGYLLLPSRRLFIFDARSGGASTFLKHNSTRNDARMRRNSAASCVAHEELQPSDFARMAALYHALYVGKYNALNPQYSARWLQLAHQHRWLQFCGLRNGDGELLAINGWFSTATTLSTPIVGYDTAVPQSLGLYRQLSALTLSEATRRACVLNFSAGAAHFKQQRGGMPFIEYSAVYIAHLPPARQQAWRLLAWLARHCAVPLMQHFDL